MGIQFLSFLVLCVCVCVLTFLLIDLHIAAGGLLLYLMEVGLTPFLWCWITHS